MMRQVVVGIMLSALFLSGCAIKVVPEAIESGVVDPSRNSLTVTRDSVKISALTASPDMADDKLEAGVAAFSLEIENQGSAEISFDNDSFILLDNTGRQYFALTPEKLREMLAKDLYYLIPYPYVGFYYLEDYEKASFRNERSSNVPYYYEAYPQDIYTKALNAGTIIPGAKVSGLVYFHIDLADVKGVKLYVYKKGSSRSNQPDFIFPFRIVK